MDKNCKGKSMTVQEAMERVLGFSILGKGYPLTIAEETSIALAAEARRLRAERDELRAALKHLILAKDILFRCVCEADDEEHLQSLVDSTDDMWNDARAILSRTEGGEVGG